MAVARGADSLLPVEVIEQYLALVAETPVSHPPLGAKDCGRQKWAAE